MCQFYGKDEKAVIGKCQLLGSFTDICNVPVITMQQESVGQQTDTS